MATSVKINEHLKNRIQNLANARNRSSHWIMCEAIRDYVEREERREAFKQDAMRAWDTYQEDGRHLTMNEADLWLKELESGNDVEPPECHT